MDTNNTQQTTQDSPTHELTLSLPESAQRNDQRDGGVSVRVASARVTVLGAIPVTIACSVYGTVAPNDDSMSFSASLPRALYVSVGKADAARLKDSIMLAFSKWADLDLAIRKAAAILTADDAPKAKTGTVIVPKVKIGPLPVLRRTATATDAPKPDAPMPTAADAAKTESASRRK